MQANTQNTRTRRLVEGFRAYTRPRVLLLFPLGFTAGLPLLLVFSTLGVWLSESGFSYAAIGATALISTPWSLKFLWAPLVDAVRIPVLHRVLGHRRSWLLVTQSAVAACILLMSTCDPISGGLVRLVSAAVAMAFCSATFDIVLDAWRVEALEERDQGAGAGAYVVGYRVAMLLAGAGSLLIAGALRRDSEVGSQTARGVIESASGVLADLGVDAPAVATNVHMASEVWPLTYRILAAFTLLGFIAILLAPEPAKSSATAAPAAEGLSRLSRVPIIGRVLEAVFGPLVAFFRSERGVPVAFAIIGFVILFKISDALIAPMLDPFLISLKFTYAEIGSIRKVWGLVATLVGALGGGYLVRAIGTMPTLWIAAVVQVVSNLMFVLLAKAGADINVLIATISIENLAGGLGTGAFVAFLSGLVSLRYTATQYALLSALAGVGRNMLSAASGWMVEATDWTTFFVLTTLAGIPGILLLALLSRLDSRGGMIDERLAPDAAADSAHATAGARQGPGDSADSS